jgi:transglutaminase-like putative cysteine protease
VNVAHAVATDGRGRAARPPAAPWWGDGGEEPPARALLPPWLARLTGFAALAALGALEWQRMVGGLSSGRALLWLLAALAVAVVLVLAGRASGRRRRLLAFGAVGGGAIAAFAVSGIDLALVRPGHWDDLATGLVDGAQALGTVKLPYEAAEPWPGVVLELLGAGLLVLAALLAFWPRADDRGYPFLSLAVLLVLVASPVVSLGGARPVLLGTALAALCVCFLWLERLPLRPGLGVAALLALALAGALPLAAVTDRGEPWFDYKAFAENLGPDDPVRFLWNQDYGPIDWPRDGNEVLRVKSDQPFYWKAANLEDFDGTAWRQRRPGEVTEPRDGDVPEDWRNRPGWTSTIEVSIRRMRSTAVISAGATMAVESSSKPLAPSGLPGTYDANPPLRRGDSYTLQVHVPKPTGGTLRQADTGLRGLQGDDLVATLPLLPGRELSYHQLGRGGQGSVDRAVLHVRPYGDQRGPYLEFRGPGVSLFRVDRVLRRTGYWRTWQLAQRLKRGTHTPLEYIVKVNRYLQTGFSYSERPRPVPSGAAPLDGFLFDTKEGYCQHFSGAMALLLRFGGVPARVVSGFSPGGYSKRRGAWIVRDTDAHAWVEAWFDGSGWVTYDPTPDATPARSQIAALEDAPPPAAAPSGSSAAGAAGPGGAARRGGGLRGDLRYDLMRDSAAGTAIGPAASGGAPWWPWALGAVALLALPAVAVVALRRRSRGEPMPPLERAVAELEAALRRAGRPAPTGTTLRQLESRLGNDPEATAYLRALSAARYGPAQPPPTATQRRALRRALGDGLGLSGRVRAWWALPPRGARRRATP